MCIEVELKRKLEKIDAMYYGAKTLGEKDAALKARRRIVQKINSQNEAKDYKFTLNNGFNVKIFIELLKRYEIQGYKKSQKERTLIIAKVSSIFVDSILWPEYQSSLSLSQI